MKHTWLWWNPGDVAVEFEQAQDEGRDLSALAGRFAELRKPDAEGDAGFQDRFDRLLDDVQEAPMRAGHEGSEPSDLAGIRAARPRGAAWSREPASEETIRDRIHGAWLGRCAGCLLGKPVEGWRSPRLWGLLKDSGHAAVTDYLWRMGIPERILVSHDAGRLLEFGRGVHYMPEDDDTNYTVAGLALVRENGIDFTPEHVADFWMRNLPILHTCTAERVAYRNFVSEIAPPASATVRNPYREWIGAQIRADFFGYVAPGRPALAAELAWRDACVSHVRNGIYGEMWVAAMLAAAAVESDVRTVIERGLAEVPEGSRLTRAIRDVIEWRSAGVDYVGAVRRIHARWNENNPHHWCHTLSNVQIVAAGLLWGEGDFELAVTRAVYPCFDTDCNGATVGSVMGMILGARKLPEKWTGILNDTVHTGIAGYNVVKISDLAGQMADLAIPRLAGLRRRTRGQ